MTTVAFDGKLLAADGLCTMGNTIQGRNTQKVFPVLINWGGEQMPALFAGAGSMEMVWIIKEYLERENLLDPECRVGMEKGEFEGILVLADGRAFMLEDTLTPFPAEVPAAIGSGAVFAQTAMTLGKNAAQAVEVASQMDIYSGGTIMVYDVESLTGGASEAA